MSVTNGGIDRKKWQRPFMKGNKASPSDPTDDLNLSLDRP